MPDIYVTDPILQLIQLGDQVIKEVRTLLPNGAGNQQFDFDRTGGQSSYSTELAQKFYGPDWDRPLRNAGAAITFGGGNCQEQAAVAYSLLREKLNNGLNASFCVSRPYKHSFAAIGNPLTDVSDSVIIVDAWPKFAQSVRWKEHFCSDQTVEVLRCKPGGQAGKIAKAKSKYTHVNVVTEKIMVLYHAPYHPHYNHQWCSMAKDTIYYKPPQVVIA
jgi:hypothetical protein